MRNAGLGSWPERRLRISPDSDAIWFEGTTTSHAGFAERVRRTASALAGLGVAAGGLLKRKVLFGSDFPLIAPDRWLRDFDALDLKPEVRPLILKDNAARVLGLATA